MEVESEEGASRGESQSQWFFMRARLALALALIRNRPPGVSGARYAEALGRQLKAHDEDGKETAQGLRLRQEELIAKLTQLADAADTNGRVSENSQDLFGPGSADPEADMDSETPDLQLSPKPQPAVGGAAPTPVHPHVSPQSFALLRHMHFLKSLGSLQRLQGGGDTAAGWFGPCGDGVPVLEDTLTELLDFVVEGTGSVLLGSCDLAVTACQASARATDLLGSQRSTQLTSRVETRLKKLSGMLLHGDQTCGLQAAANLKRCLVVLGSSSSLKSLLIRHIMSELSALTDQLWQVIQVADGSGLRQFPLVQYQNSPHLFSVLEELLRGSDTAWQAEAGPELRRLQRCLEERVFPLSEEFHLFSLRMWRLGGLARDPGAALGRPRRR